MRLDVWHMTPDMWNLTCDTWHVTCNTGHVTHGWGWTFSQNFSFLALTVWDLWCSEDLEEKDYWINQLINYKGYCRTAPATPGLLINDQLIMLLYVQQPWVYLVYIYFVNDFNKKFMIVFISQENLASYRIKISFRLKYLVEKNTSLVNTLTDDEIFVLEHFVI